jgi:prophage regulatory protein
MAYVDSGADRGRLFPRRQTGGVSSRRSCDRLRAGGYWTAHNRTSQFDVATQCTVLSRTSLTIAASSDKYSQQFQRCAGTVRCEDRDGREQPSSPAVFYLCRASPTKGPWQMSLLTFDDLRARGISLSADQISRLETQGRFPRRVRISERGHGWLESEVTAWVGARAAERFA